MFWCSLVGADRPPKEAMLVARQEDLGFGVLCWERKVIRAEKIADDGRVPLPARSGHISENRNTVLEKSRHMTGYTPTFFGHGRVKVGVNQSAVSVSRCKLVGTLLCRVLTRVYPVGTFTLLYFIFLWVNTPACVWQYVHRTRESPDLELKYEVCCVCVFSSHLFWTSNLLEVPAGITQHFSSTFFCGACLYFSREKNAAVRFPRRP